MTKQKLPKKFYFGGFLPMKDVLEKNWEDLQVAFDEYLRALKMTANEKMKEYRKDYKKIFDDLEKPSRERTAEEVVVGD